MTTRCVQANHSIRFLPVLPLFFALLGPFPALAAEEPEKLTLEVVNVEILDVLKLLSKRSGLNIVVGPEIKGQVSIFLKDVPIREGLKTILQSRGLAYYEEDGIFKVISEREYQERFGIPFGDVRTMRTFPVRHADATELAATLNFMKSPAGKIVVDGRSNTLVVTDTPRALDDMHRLVVRSDRPLVTRAIKIRYARIEDLEAKLQDAMRKSFGHFAIDKRSNKIFITDIPSRVSRISAMIKAFDVKTPQVLIEAKVIEVHLTDGYRQGINWNAVLRNASLSIPLNVTAPTGSSLTTLTSSRGDLTVVLQAIEAMGKTNTLSSPRITALDNQEAKLAVATKQPYVSQTVVQTTNSTNTADNVQFVDVGVTLNVQPRILSGGLIEMKIKPQVSASTSSLELQGVASGSNTAFTRTRIPIVTTQELETVVTVRSGTTIIVGGLIQDQQGKQRQGVPFLRRMPVVGHLFSSESDNFDKTELVMFLTPTLVEDEELAKFAREEERFFEPAGVLKRHPEVGDSPTPAALAGKPLLAVDAPPYWEKKSVNVRKR